MHRRAWTWLVVAIWACGDSPNSPGTPVADAGDGDGDEVDSDAGDPMDADAGDDSDGGQPSLPIDAGEDCQVFVADPLIDHSCFHAVVGPYEERDFTASSAVLDVSNAHTAFLLTLPAVEGGYQATMGYYAQNPGGYAFFSAPTVELSIVRDGTEQELPVFTAHDTELCPELPWVQAFQLATGHHTLRLKSPTPESTLVIEWMDEGGKAEYGYRSACPLPPRPDAGAEPRDDGGVSQDGGDSDTGDAATEDGGDETPML
jgi:hypothetical protein